MQDPEGSGQFVMITWKDVAGGGMNKHMLSAQNTNRHTEEVNTDPS